MLDGVTSDNLDPVAIADEFMVNRSGSTGVQPFDKLAQQLASTGAVANALVVSQLGMQIQPTWALLSAKPINDGQFGRVTTNDGSTHTGYYVDAGGNIVSAPGVKNWGEYVAKTGVDAWVRTGDVFDPPMVQAEIDTKADQTSLDAVASDVAVASALVPLLDHWDQVKVDEPGRPLWGIKDDKTEWKLIAGQLVQIDAGGTGDGEVSVVPLLGNWRAVTIGPDGLPSAGQKFDGSFWQAVGGVLVQVSGSAGSTGLETYTWNLASFSSIAIEALAGLVDYLILLIGQSWDGGYSYDSGDATVTTTAQHPGHALMTDAGRQPKVDDGAAAPINGYLDLVESPRGTASLETPLSGIADSIMRGCQARFGVKPRIVFAISARGGTAYSRLRRGSPQYTEVLRIVDRCRAVSAAQGRTLEVLCMGSFHGQQDSLDGTSKEEYLADINAWQTDLDADIRRITGQARPVKLYMAQNSYRGLAAIGAPREPALAQLEAPKRNPYVRHVGPLYQNPGTTADGGGHLKAAGFYQAGLLMGKAILEGEFGPKWAPLECVEAWWTSSTTIMLRYNQALGLENDDTRIKISNLGGGRGVDFLDGSGSPPTVSSIAIASGTTDTIEVTLSTAPTGLRPRIFIAARAPEGGSGATTGNRSAIRSATAFDTAPLTGVDLYHWACQQVINLPPL